MKHFSMIIEKMSFYTAILYLDGKREIKHCINIKPQMLKNPKLCYY